MVNDEQRRDVAAGLRMLDVSDIGDDDNIVDSPEESGILFNRILEIANDYRAGLHYFPSHFVARDAVELFSYMIDRPTCRNVSGYKDTFECSECRLKVDVVGEEGNEYGDVFSTPFMPRYCPNCGKEVVE